MRKAFGGLACLLIGAALFFPQEAHALGCGDYTTLTSSADYDPANPPIAGTLRHALEIELEYCGDPLQAPVIYIPNGFAPIVLVTTIRVEAQLKDDEGNVLKPRVRIIGAQAARWQDRKLARITAPGPNYTLLRFDEVHAYIEGVGFDSGERAIYSSAASLEIFECRFERLKALGAVNRRGGGIHFSSGSGGLTVQRSTFISNEAGSMGAAVFAYGALEVILAENYFADNRAYASENGGLIYGGGAAAIFFARTTLVNNTFSKNRIGTNFVGGLGGAVALFETPESFVVMNGFSENEAQRAGALAVFSGNNSNTLDQYLIGGNRFLKNVMLENASFTSFEAFEFSAAFPMNVTLHYNVMDQNTTTLPVLFPQGWHVPYNLANNWLIAAGWPPITIRAMLNDLVGRRILNLQNGEPGTDLVSPAWNPLLTPDRDQERNVRGVNGANLDAGPDEYNLCTFDPGHNSCNL